MSVNNGLGEAGRSRSEEEDSLRVGLCRSEPEVLRAFLSLRGLLNVIEQLDVQTSSTSFIELPRSDLVGQPDGLDSIGSQESVKVLNVSLTVVELSGEVGEEARDEASAESRPNGQHIILVGRQVDNDDGLLAGGRGSSVRRAESRHERESHGLDGGLEPRNIIHLGSSRRGDKSEGRPVSVSLSGPCEHLGESTQARWGDWRQRGQPDGVTKREGRTGNTPVLRRRERGRDHRFDVSDGTFARLGRGNSDGGHCR
jgi:hypothetical protein